MELQWRFVREQLFAILNFFQFHPTCLYIAGAARVLISEIVRGHGGVLRNKMGDRFMDESHPDAELAPRDGC